MNTTSRLLSEGVAPTPSGPVGGAGVAGDPCRALPPGGSLYKGLRRQGRQTKHRNLQLTAQAGSLPGRLRCCPEAQMDEVGVGVRKGEGRDLGSLGLWSRSQQLSSFWA